MNELKLRASVRRVAEFTLRSGDLVPVSLAAMQAGTRGHLARQAASEAQSERAFKWTGECEGVPCEITGRADLLWENRTPPCIEELKLASLPPASPLPVHRMQAVGYAFMLCEECGLSEAAVCVSYISETGEVLAAFEETLTREKAKAQFFSVLAPMAKWTRQLHEYRQKRDQSLSRLPFPYDTFRPGQREMAAQVYTAIRRRKRLFSVLPTGTGKSAAALFPALKALGEGHTRQIFYLTARGTAQLSALDALGRMCERGLVVRSLVLTAKEKRCPMKNMRCHPDHCPRARGYFDRQLPALVRMAEKESWTVKDIDSVCNEFSLCPFEFTLDLSEISDVVICDYNYVFDPMVALKRIVGQGLPFTLLIDEAHNLPSRTRDMLSGTLDSHALTLFRRSAGAVQGRKAPLYKACSAVIKGLRSTDQKEISILADPLNVLIEELGSALSAPPVDGVSDMLRALLQFRLALQRYLSHPEQYRPLFTGRSNGKTLKLLCLEVSLHLREATKKLYGCVCFSATLAPLPAMRALLGGDEDDALFELPSPFLSEHLLTLQASLSTRYQSRQSTAKAVAEAIKALFDGCAGSYIAYFPSYAYLEMIQAELEALDPALPLNVQQRRMDDQARSDFLDCIRNHEGALLSLCVMGGVFAEGVDLPGAQLIGAAVVGVGLPQVNDEQEELRTYYNQTQGDGFAFAYRYPGMQKVLQSAGRVIRSESDRGVILLIDDRYRENAYRELLPAHWQVHFARSNEEIRRLAQEFWHSYGIDNR